MESLELNPVHTLAWEGTMEKSYPKLEKSIYSNKDYGDNKDGASLVRR